MPGDFGPPHLGLLAGLLSAHGTGHQHLWLDGLACIIEELYYTRAREENGLTGLEVCGHDVRQTVNKSRVDVGSRTASDPLSPDLLANVVSIFYVQLVQGLNVIVDKCDGDKHEILLTLLHHDLDSVLRAGLEPGQRPHLALPDQPVWIGPAELLHH